MFTNTVVSRSDVHQAFPPRESLQIIANCFYSACEQDVPEVLGEIKEQKVLPVNRSSVLQCLGNCGVCNIIVLKWKMEKGIPLDFMRLSRN